MGAPQSNDDDMISGINVTPLVDVVLVLLIIFMVTATFIATPSIKIDLPKAATGDSTPPSSLGLVLAKDGTLYLNGEPADHARVKEFIAAELAEEKQVQAIISADKDVAHGSVIGLIDMIKTAGVTKFAINVEP
jgi:biopolymer transport protein TolR